ncbi:MAG: glutamyl-tRNA reductase [Omnitrophica WOR_2 bacterium]
MHIHCLGLNHRTASIQLREKLAFSEEAVKAALARLGCGGLDLDSINEIIILSTCNRVEIYAVAHDLSFDELQAFLSEARGVSQEELNGNLYRLADREAVDHLLRVSAGLDSLVLGEPQILGQVIHALELSRGQNTAGPVLSRLFQAAAHTGKRVRTETAITQNPASISSVAIRLAAKVFPRLESARIAVLGAGEMAELVVEALRKRGASQIQVINRTLERARGLAGRWEAQAATFENLPEVLQTADILIASTGAPHTLVHPDLVAQVMEKRPNRPLVMIDIAVPRDIDAEVGKIPGVRVYDMDALQNHLEQSLAARQREVPGAETILKDELDSFMGYVESLDALSVIKWLRQQAEGIRQAELEKTLRRMPDLSDAERRRIEAMSEALVKKILHAPIKRLRMEANCIHLAEYSFVARSLFSAPYKNNGNGKHSCSYTPGNCPFSYSHEEPSSPPISCDP